MSVLLVIVLAAVAARFGLTPCTKEASESGRPAGVPLGWRQPPDASEPVRAEAISGGAARTDQKTKRQKGEHPGRVRSPKQGDFREA